MGEVGKSDGSQTECARARCAGPYFAMYTSRAHSQSISVRPEKKGSRFEIGHIGVMRWRKILELERTASAEVNSKPCSNIRASGPRPQKQQHNRRLCLPAARDGLDGLCEE